MLHLAVILPVLILPTVGVMTGLWYLRHRKLLETRMWFRLTGLLVSIAAFPVSITFAVLLFFFVSGLSLHPYLTGLWFSWGYAVVLFWGLWFFAGRKLGGFKVIAPRCVRTVLLLVVLVVALAEAANIWGFWMLSAIYKDEWNAKVVCETVGPQAGHRVIAVKYFTGHGGAYDTDLYAQVALGLYRHLMEASACSDNYAFNWSQDGHRFLFSEGYSKDGRQQAPVAGYDISTGESFYPAGKGMELYSQGDKGAAKAHRRAKDFLAGGNP